MKKTLFTLAVLLLAYVTFAFNPNPDPPTDGLVGSNYTPAYAVNQVQFWHDFRPEVVEKELEAAKKYFGISTLRVFLHNINFDEEKEIFLDNIDKFLEICEKHEIRPGFVFFDDCHRLEGIYLDKPTEPVKGWHNGRWAACPQKRERDPENFEKFKPYIQEVIKAHQADERILFWEIYNEPIQAKDGLNYSLLLRRKAYDWAKAVNPVQPVISSWDDNEATDIVDAHNYIWRMSTWDTQADMNPSKGTVFTEAGARWHAPRISNREPIEVIYWLENRRAAGRSTPGVYLNWELMVGNSNCRWYWGTSEQSPEPTFPWCGLLWPDATPVSLAEAEAIKGYATGQRSALLFDDFQDIHLPAKPGWKVQGQREGSGVLSISPGYKLLYGDTAWDDYIVESVVMLKDSLGKARMIFRANQTELESDDIMGYFVEFDRKELVLGKMKNENLMNLASYDLGQLECKIKGDEWNHLRFQVVGNRIKIWFNRMHPSADPENGLRIDYFDNNPFLSGSIGLEAVKGDVWYDNLIVLPANEGI